MAIYVGCYYYNTAAGDLLPRVGFLFRIIVPSFSKLAGVVLKKSDGSFLQSQSFQDHTDQGDP